MYSIVGAEAERAGRTATIKPAWGEVDVGLSHYSTPVPSSDRDSSTAGSSAYYAPLKRRTESVTSASRVTYDKLEAQKTETLNFGAGKQHYGSVVGRRRHEGRTPGPSSSVCLRSLAQHPHACPWSNGRESSSRLACPSPQEIILRTWCQTCPAMVSVPCVRACSGWPAPLGLTRAARLHSQPPRGSTLRFLERMPRTASRHWAKAMGPFSYGQRTHSKVTPLILVDDGVVKVAGT